MTARVVALAGATGPAGRAILEGLLADASVAAVHALGRRAPGLSHPKLTPHVLDFAALSPLPPNDLVSGGAPVDLSIPSGSTFPLGTTTVTVMATDAAGNKATGTFTVTVVETTGPVINVPGQPVTAVAAGTAGAVVNSRRRRTAATVGDLFRYDAPSGQYIFNRDTKPLSSNPALGKGTYVLFVDLGDGVQRAVLVSLKD